MYIATKKKRWIVCPHEFKIKIYFDDGYYIVKDFEDFDNKQKEIAEEQTQVDFEISDFLKQYPNYKVEEVNVEEL